MVSKKFIFLRKRGIFEVAPKGDLIYMLEHSWSLVSYVSQFFFVVPFRQKGISLSIIYILAQMFGIFEKYVKLHGNWEWGLPIQN